MGASHKKEKLESKILMLKLRRIEIRQERNEIIKQLKELTGKDIIREPIPDYIDISDEEINQRNFYKKKTIRKEKNNENNEDYEDDISN